MEEALLSSRAFDPGRVLPIATEWKALLPSHRESKIARKEDDSGLPGVVSLDAFSDTFGAQLSGNRTGMLTALFEDFKTNFVRISEILVSKIYHVHTVVFVAADCLPID